MRSDTNVRKLSSYQIFLKFVRYTETGVDATSILSPECYQLWLRSRKQTPKKPGVAFRRALTVHVRGIEGRKPFSPEIESSLLKLLRNKQPWGCFDSDDKEAGRIGSHGFASLGYHEQIEKQSKDSCKESPGNLVSRCLEESMRNETYLHHKIDVLRLCSEIRSEKLG